MARKKVTLQYIPNDSTRRGTFKKRRRGLMKKAGELAILCDVKACVVVYGEGDSVPEVFPSSSEAVAILNQFKSMPELDQCKKKMNQEGFFRQRIDKLRDQVHKSGRDCRDREVRFLLHKAMVDLPGIDGLSIEELTSVGWKVEVLLKSIGDQIMKIRSHRSFYQPSCQAQPSPGPYLTARGMDMGDPAMYQDHAPPLQEKWLDMVRSGGGDLNAVVYNGLNGSHDGAGTSASASAGDDVMQPLDVGAGFAWQWAASPCYFPPMSAARSG